MTHTREELQAKPEAELREIADKLKIKLHHKAGPDSIIEKIVAQPIAYQRDAMKHVAEKVAAPVFDNTEEEILEAIRPFRKEGFDIKFPGDGTWIFSYKGREESGNMHIPLRVIRGKAENVSRGALRLKQMMFDGELIIAG